MIRIGSIESNQLKKEIDRNEFLVACQCSIKLNYQNITGLPSRTNFLLFHYFYGRIDLVVEEPVSGYYIYVEHRGSAD